MTLLASKHRASGPNAVSLLHFDGTNGSTTITDVYGNTWTALGTAALSTTQVKFGTASLAPGNAGISTPSSAAFLPGSGDFTYEAWIYPIGYGSTQMMIFAKQSSPSSFSGMNAIINSTTHVLEVVIAQNNSSWGLIMSGATVVTLNTWHHAAFVRHGNLWSIYLDGTLDNSSTVSFSVYDDGSVQYIGADQGPNYSFSGYIDEARISQVARYTANFTPTGPFTN